MIYIQNNEVSNFNTFVVNSYKVDAHYWCIFEFDIAIGKGCLTHLKCKYILWICN